MQPRRRQIAPGRASHARVVRHEPTGAEKRLWKLLRDRRSGSLKFRRQVPLGPHIVDFV
ncbi:MAG: DUF559 domain-containing protein [Hyphomicrobiales bacterium]